MQTRSIKAMSISENTVVVGKHGIYDVTGVERNGDFVEAFLCDVKNGACFKAHWGAYDQVLVAN